tara:strand:- start:424 stop:1149 length:726 start_codon:yes stop_codon:yes gene_type:complete
MDKKWYEKDYRGEMKSYKDVPGFINEAEFIFEDIISTISLDQVTKRDEKYHVVELGTFLGQSACRMASLINEYEIDNITFDSIDLFWLPMHIMSNRDDWDEKTQSGIPPSFHQYIEWLNKIVKDAGGVTLSPIDVTKHPVRILGLEDFVNFITCDTQYAARLYDDETLDFVWCDACHDYEYILKELETFWPKIKKGGMIAGDDYNTKDVKKAVKEFQKKYNKSIVGLETTDISFKIKKSNI